MPPVDPNEVMMTGENSFIRLSPDGGKTLSDRASHWRVLWCPAQAATSFFAEHAHRRPREDLQRQHRGGAVALKSIEALLFPAFADVPARLGELRGGTVALSTATESVVAPTRDHAVLVRLHRAVRAQCASRLQ
jgi:hypothetical protein